MKAKLAARVVVSLSAAGFCLSGAHMGRVVGTDTNWRPGQPNEYPDGDDYATTNTDVEDGARHDGTWGDGLCSLTETRQDYTDSAEQREMWLWPGNPG